MSDVAAELERNRVAGEIVTPVHDVWRKARLLVAGEPRVTFGLGSLLPTSVEEVIGALRTLTRWDFPAEGGSRGERCWVDPRAVVELASDAAIRLAEACARRERVLFATGHPAGPIVLYAELAREMAARGAEVLRFAEEEPFPSQLYGERAHIRYVGDVACVSAGGELLHTHSAAPMEYLLDTGPMPDLVVGDHGFAGVGLARGADAVAMVDTNDPALALAWARGLPIRPIVCDDNRTPSAYDPMLRLLVGRL